MIEFFNYTVKQKLEISERLAFIRSIRDIAQGLEKAMVEVSNGTPDGVVRNYIISQLKQNPVFWKNLLNEQLHGAYGSSTTLC